MTIPEHVLVSTVDDKQLRHLGYVLRQGNPRAITESECVHDLGNHYQ